MKKKKILLKKEGEYRNLHQQKNHIELEAKEAVELEKKVNFWSAICGQLYSFLENNDVATVKFEKRCEKISKIARKERSRRKKMDRRNKKMVKTDKIYSEILYSRTRTQ